jgi:hypothetical protein
MTDQANADNIPRYARYQGKRVRVIEYSGDGYFTILDSNDQQHRVKRERLTFLRAKKK